MRMGDGGFALVIGIVLILAFIGVCALFTFLTMFLLAELGVTLKVAIWLTIVMALMWIGMRLNVS